MVVLTLVIAFAAAGSFASSLAMWWLTRSYARSFYRPHLGVTHVHKEEDATAKYFAFSVEFRNVGACPAKNVTSDWIVLVNGFPIQLAPHVPVPNQKAIVFPQSEYFLDAALPTEHYSGVMAETSVLQFVVNFAYQGVTKKTYRYYAKYQYRPQVHRFMPIEGDFK
jgi:hypothetical protein